MTDVEPVVTDFAATGRTGRRNAMPDILGSNAGAGASEIQEKLAELSVSGTIHAPNTANQIHEGTHTDTNTMLFILACPSISLLHKHHTLWITLSVMAHLSLTVVLVTWHSS